MYFKNVRFRSYNIVKGSAGYARVNAAAAAFQVHNRGSTTINRSALLNGDDPRIDCRQAA